MSEKPDLTLKANYPIFGDTVTFEKNLSATKKQIFTGVISEWNVAGPQVWKVNVDGDPMHVHGDEILSIERTGEIPEYIPK